MLSRDHIKAMDVHRADKMLNEFADLFEHFYGKNSITHMLRHYAYSVLNTGPLWCQSMFCFESNIGEIKRSFNSTVDVVEQVAFNYCIKAAVQEKLVGEVQTPEILRLKLKPIEEKNISSLINASYPNMSIAGKYQIGYEMRWRSEVLKSVKSSISKSVDRFIQLKDGTVGEVQLFIQFDKPYVVIKVYKVVKTNHHLFQIAPGQPEKYVICAHDAVRHKLIYLRFNYSNVAFIEVVTLEPNTFEGS